MNKELKEYLYMLVGNELTYEDKEKILSFFNDLKQKNDRLRHRNRILHDNIDKAIEKLKEHKHDLDYEPWNEYKISGSILFDLVNILKGSVKSENEIYNK